MILYMSATGNTRWAAKRLSEAFNEELIAINSLEDDEVVVELSENEALGICFPVHAWRPPLMVCRLLERIKVVSPTPFYCYALCTAGDNIGETMTILQRTANKRGLNFDAFFSLLMPESYVGLPFMDVDNPEKEREKKQKAAEKLERIIKTISNRERNVEMLTIGRWPKTNSRLLGWFFYNFLINDKKFWVNTQKCIGCGKCAKVCPIENIETDDSNKPHWLHNLRCMTCFACYHNCPTHAIEFGKQTKNKGQYYFEKQSKTTNDQKKQL